MAAIVTLTKTHLQRLPTRIRLRKSYGKRRNVDNRYFLLFTAMFLKNMFKLNYFLVDCIINLLTVIVLAGFKYNEACAHT